MITCKVKKEYKSNKKNFSLNVNACFKTNTINVLFGVSGSGKTSLLRLISGLDKPDSGSIVYNNSCWFNSSKKKSTPINKRNIAYVFQDYALFPNMTVLQNLQFANKEKNSDLLNDLITTLQIQHLVKSKPNQLSGGQQQRVALARAIIQQPDLLLLDEPLTAIDETLRFKLQNYIKQLQQKYNFTVIMVSHNLQEVLNLAKHVVVINYGEIIDQGSLEILLGNNPKNTLIANVLNIKEDYVTVLIATQQITIKKSKIIEHSFIIGDKVTLSL